MGNKKTNMDQLQNNKVCKLTSRYVSSFVIPEYYRTQHEIPRMGRNLKYLAGVDGYKLEYKYTMNAIERLRIEVMAHTRLYLILSEYLMGRQVH